MRPAIALAAALACLCACRAPPPPAPPPSVPVTPPVRSPDEAARDAVNHVFREWVQPGEPGCTVAIAQNGKLVHARERPYDRLGPDAFCSAEGEPRVLHVVRDGAGHAAAVTLSSPGARRVRFDRLPAPAPGG